MLLCLIQKNSWSNISFLDICDFILLIYQTEKAKRACTSWLGGEMLPPISLKHVARHSCSEYTVCDYYLWTIGPEV